MTETPNPNIIDADTLTGEMRPIRRAVLALGSNLGERLATLQGAVDAITRTGGEVAYRLCRRSHHHHLVCSGCGAVVELAPCDVGGWAAAQASHHGFDIEDHELTDRKSVV